MADRHLNLFYTYGGSARWEDNFTRAFLLTLQNLAPVHFRMFLRDMLLDDDHEELRKRVDLRAHERPEFDLQVSEAARDGDPPLTSENGVLVTIDTTGVEELSIKEGSADGGARVDALVADPEADVTAVIEVKMGDTQSQDQLRRHHRAFFDREESDPDAVHVAVNWEDVVEYLDSLKSQSVGDKERYVLGEFVDYADELGLAPFRGFQERDFRQSRSRTLRKLIQIVTARYGDELQAEVGSSPAHRMDFDDVSENIWIDYRSSPDSVLWTGVVAGADGIWHARQFKKAFELKGSAFGEVADQLVQEVNQRDSELAVGWRPQTRIWASRGQRTHPPSVTSYLHPDGFDAFVERMLNDAMNPCDWIPRETVEERLEDELHETDLQTDNEGVYPPWEGKEEVLLNSYFHLEVLTPSDKLVRMGREATVELMRDVLAPLRTAAVRLNELKNSV